MHKFIIKKNSTGKYNTVTIQQLLEAASNRQIDTTNKVLTKDGEQFDWSTLEAFDEDNDDHLNILEEEFGKEAVDAIVGNEMEED